MLEISKILQDTDVHFNGEKQDDISATYSAFEVLFRERNFRDEFIVKLQWKIRNKIDIIISSVRMESALRDCKQRKRFVDLEKKIKE